jgi:hypothetical protein
MEFDRGVPFSRCSATALPTSCQFVWQRNSTAVFEHDRLKPTQQLHRDFPIGLDHHASHLLQHGMQEMGTRSLQSIPRST